MEVSTSFSPNSSTMPCRCFLGMNFPFDFPVNLSHILGDFLSLKGKLIMSSYTCMRSGLDPKGTSSQNKFIIFLVENKTIYVLKFNWIHWKEMPKQITVQFSNATFHEYTSFFFPRKIGTWILSVSGSLAICQLIF